MAVLHKIKATAQACTRGSFSLLAAAAMVFAAGTSAQNLDTAYVPFRVNVDATATAQLAGGEKFEKLVRAGSTDTLHIISESTTPVISGKTPRPVAMHISRGKISLELSRQLYKGVDIALYSLNGKQIMHARADASETIKSISHPNIRMGVYVLSVKGISGSIFTTRLTHSGGGMNIDVSLANENFSSGSLMEKALSGNWTITVSAEGHLDTSYAFVPETGRGKHSVHHITLRQTSSAAEDEPSSSSAEDEPSYSSAAVVPSSSAVAVVSSSSSAIVVVPSSSSSTVVVLSSSSAVAIPSSSSAEDEPSSSSTEDEPSSSSSVPASSSSAEPLACGTVPALGYATIPITPPALACGNGATATSVRWLGSPPIDWDNPKEGTHSGISVMANCGTAANLIASCPGTLAVRPMISCGMASSAVYEGVAITPPVLACSNGSTPFNIVLSGYLPPDLDNPTAGDYAVFAEADCGHGTTPTVFCGTLKVNPATLTCGSVPASEISDVAITPPALTCNNGKTATDIAWSGNAPDWDSPVSDTYSNISVTAACGSATKTASCNGTLKVNPATLICGSVPASGFSGFAITQPVLTCNNGKTPSDITWSANAPNWSNPAAGTYSSISATANCGTSSNLTASCSGTLAVQPMISCSMASTGYEGAEINQPALTCKNGFVPSGIVFSGSVPNWDNPAAGDYEVFAAADCGQGISPAVSCGALTVNEVTLTCGSVPVSGYEDAEITPPVLTCNNGKTASNITWSGAPDWDSPATGTYSGISVTAACGSVTKTTSCNGSLTVNPATLTCGSVPVSGYEGAEITSPDLTCNNGKTANNITWSGAPDWDSPATGTYNNISVTAACGSVTKTANCNGSLTVNPATLTCGSVPVLEYEEEEYEGVEITPLVLTCNNGKTATDVTWENAPDWDSPATGTYNNIRVTAACGLATKTARCSRIHVNLVTLTCDLPTSGTPSIAITPPVLTCNNGKTATDIDWSAEAPNWSNPATGIYHNISVEAACGTSGRKSNHCFNDDEYHSVIVSCANKNTSTQYCSNGTMKTYGSVTYQGQKYKTVVIGAQTWMAENLNYDPHTGNSACSENQTSNCDKYGRLYDWSTAMGFSSSCNSNNDCSSLIQSKHRGICPSGWHIPSNDDWDILINYVGGSEIAGTELKAMSGWNKDSYNNSYNTGNGTDNYGFSALPSGDWWSASEGNSDGAYIRFMGYYGDLNKSYLFSVRCLQDNTELEPVLNCVSLPTNGISELAITPVLTCSNGKTASNITWSASAPTWDSPASGTYSNISATATCGTSSSLTANCSGSLTVNPATLTCGSVPGGVSDVAITPPVLTCSNGKTASNITWSASAPTWNSPAFGTYSNISATATCGTSSSLTAECDSLIVSCANKNTSTQYCSEGTMKTYGSVLYQGQTYKTVVIGTQTWMAENLNYDPSTGNSACYENQTSNCDKYGRLYDWSTAMDLESSCNYKYCSSQIQTKHKGICPSGWHIPSRDDWNILFNYAGSIRDIKLRVVNWWNDGYGIDYYGFSALPGGSGLSDGSFIHVGYGGIWWSASEDGSRYTYYRSMRYGNEFAAWYDYGKSDLRSVRCLQD